MMHWPFRREPDKISPLVASICNCLAKQPEQWKIEYFVSADTGQIEEALKSKARFGLKDRSERLIHELAGTQIELDRETGVWEIWHPRHKPNKMEYDALLQAINKWGSSKIDGYLPVAEHQPIHQEEEPREPGQIKDLDYLAEGWEEGDEDEMFKE